MNLSNQELNIIKNILKRYNFEFFIFGSRAKDSAHRFSDLDLAFFDEIPYWQINEIRNDFAESDLEFKVDLVDLKKVDKTFYELIKNDLKKL